MLSPSLVFLDFHRIGHLKSRVNVKFCLIHYGPQNASYFSSANSLTFDNMKGQGSTTCDTGAHFERPIV